MMAKKKKKNKSHLIWVKAITVIAVMFVGNRIYNHVNSWLGLFVILIDFLYILYTIKKIIK